MTLPLNFIQARYTPSFGVNRTGFVGDFFI